MNWYEKAIAELDKVRSDIDEIKEIEAPPTQIDNILTGLSHCLTDTGYNHEALTYIPAIVELLEKAREK